MLKTLQRRSPVGWGQGALTDSRPSANVTLIILRAVRAALHADRRVLACRGWEGEINGLLEHPGSYVGAEQSGHCSGSWSESLSF